MRDDLRQTVAKHKEGLPAVPVICSDYSAFDAIADITGVNVGTKEELFENPVPSLSVFRSTVKVGKKSLSPEEAEKLSRKEGKRRDETYSVDEVREIVRVSHLGSESGLQTIVLFDADKMTVEAANAFLKTLEDVPKGVFFILTATSRSRMPETVLSRCLSIDSNDEALTPTPEMTLAVDEFARGNPAPFLKLSAGKTDRAWALTALRLFSEHSRKGAFTPAGAKAVSESYVAIATTNVASYHELDRAIFALGYEVLAKKG